ncbi:ferritin family protein [Streptomyces sp. NPDC001848]|uniref:ferritin family protein n=1 Tax=Streptomyces sp. NPDC001848 TaxID=3364618 RepID=UPI0036AC82E5
MHIRLAVPAIAVLAVMGTAAPATMAASSSTTPAAGSDSRQLMIDAAKTESAASLQYAGYADGALRSGRPDLADVWQSVGLVEHQDHWMHEVTEAGLYSATDNAANLRTAIEQAQQSAKAYTDWAAQAPENSAAATELRAVAARQTAAAGLLTQALSALQGKGQVPAAPSVSTVAIQVSKAPHHTGSFYNALTNDTNSALTTAAWNWAEYQSLAQTAVNTGQARLAALFAALAAQERHENWPRLSNAAGYVNSDATDLKTSIASEQEAIDMYARYADEAQKAGDKAAADFFSEAGGDEMHHKLTFQQLTGQG